GVPLPARQNGASAAKDEDNPAGGGAGGGGIPLSWTPTNHSDEQEPDGATARRIVEIIEQNKNSGKPFFVGCGFHKPHLPWVAPKKYFDMYSIDDIKLPRTPPDDRDDIPPIALTFAESDPKLTDLLLRHATLTYR